ncbi:MAG: protein-export chaperone SecB [Gammaproteobacteria bacterium]|nr:protein-export chaperone SecB [Gammaproteobacteria bacterium]
MADEPVQDPQMANPQAQGDRQLLLQKIYIKDLSFESPKAPEIFTSNVQAQTQLNVGSSNKQIDPDHVEVSLTLTVTSKAGEDTVFLIEIVQAGIFTIKGYNQDERAMLLGSFCPGTLYPFAREAVAEAAQKGGFPQLLLQPINFDAVYAQAMQERQAQAAAAQGQQPAAVESPPAQPANPGGGDTH